MKKLLKTQPLASYFLLTYAFSWLIWIPMAIASQGVSYANGDMNRYLILLLLGAFSPSIIGIFMTTRTKDKAGRRDFWRRVIDFRRISLGWYAFIALVFPAVMGAAFLIEKFLGGSIPSLEGAFQTLANPAALLYLVITMIIGGPLAEELGWRGFALDHLQEKLSPLQSSLALGFLHALWHLPLFFIAGTYQGDVGFATPLYWIFVVQVTIGAVFPTWAYNYNQRSILTAILLHFTSNFTLTLVAQLGHALPLRTEIIRTLVLAVIAAALVYVWKPKQAKLELGEALD